MSAPITVEHHFAAVRVTYGTQIKTLNRDRLAAAINLLKTEQARSAGEQFRAAYPDVSPGDMHDYMVAAQRCIDRDVEV